MNTSVWLEFRDANDNLIEKIDVSRLTIDSYPIPDKAINYRIYFTFEEQDNAF